MVNVYKGIFYFDHRKSAELWADAVQASRVIVFARGYAVQYHASGSYVSTAQPIRHIPCKWCPLLADGGEQ